MGPDRMTARLCSFPPAEPGRPSRLEVDGEMVVWPPWPEELVQEGRTYRHLSAGAYLRWQGPRPSAAIPTRLVSCGEVVALCDPLGMPSQEEPPLPFEDDEPTQPSYLTRLAESEEGAQVLQHWFEVVEAEEAAQERLLRDAGRG